MVRGQNLIINKRGGWNKRGGGISMGKEIIMNWSILKLEECLRCQNLAKIISNF